MAPVRVWTHLADLEAYEYWHPSYRFEEAAAAGRTIDLSYALFRRGYRIRAEATITVFDKPHLIAWSVGIGGGVVFRESYELEAVGTGTQIRHEIAFESFAGKLVGKLFSRTFGGTLRSQDLALLSYLKKESRGGDAGLNRHRRRARKARRTDNGR
ncbi:hypothetical protein EIK56_09615 [Sphingomonas sp. C8-2]|nr:hypothetical protein EIK56_09615 [Sphingomonas sp. C8-2]